jgi:hypothetical protein
MTTLVWGHGIRDRGEEKTFVPDGTTVKWYSDLDQNLFTRNGFVAVSSGEFGSPNDQQGPGRGTEVEIYNYGVAEDLVKRDYVAMLNRQGLPLMFIGSEIPEGHLCNDLPGCRGKGEHTCDGVLGKAKDTEVVILVCRGVAGMQGQSTLAYGSDVKDPLSSINEDTTGFINAFLNRVTADPASAEQEFDGLGDPVKIIMRTDMRIPAWQAIRWAADAGRKGSISDLFTQLRENLNDQRAEQFLTIGYYADGLAAGARSDVDEFFRTMEKFPGTLTTRIEAIPAIAALKQSWEKGRQAFADATWSPDDAALDRVSTKNGQNVKAAGDGDSLPIRVGGVLALIGSGHDPQSVNYVERQGDFEQGSLTVTKGGAFSKGGIEVKGLSPGKEGLVTAVVTNFSDKKVTFA